VRGLAWPDPTPSHPSHTIMHFFHPAQCAAALRRDLWSVCGCMAELRPASAVEFESKVIAMRHLVAELGC